MARSGRTTAATMFAALATVLSCRDIPAPQGGVLAVSPLQLPSPAVVVGDTMRDSVGVAAPLRVIAYGIGGTALDPQPTATYVLLDTGSRVAHFAGELLIGDRPGSVRIVGNVAGVQTLPQLALITLRPDTIVPSDSAHQVRAYDFFKTPADSMVSADMSVQVQNRSGSSPAGVDGVIVRYSITRSPDVATTGPSVILLNGGAQSTRDTTSGGVAMRTLRFRLAAVSGATDSAQVNATAAYRGKSLGTVQFTVVFRKNP